MLIRFFLFLAVFIPITAAEAQPGRRIKLRPVQLGLDLPESYKSRTFIRGLAGFANNIDQLVGSMILVENNKTSVLTRFVKEGKPPVVSTMTSEVIYNAKIDAKFKFNGAYAIASTKVERDAVYELVITDIAVAFLPEDYIPYLEICRAAGQVAPETRKKTYYVRSAKLTSVYTRAFRKITTDNDVAGMAFSVGNDIFSSSDQFKLDYIVSVDLVSLENLLSLQNCEQLVNSEELAQRERAEKARLEAQKAEETRKGLESELNTVRAQVDELRRLLGQSVEQNTALQKQITETQSKEKTLAIELEAAKQTALNADAQARQEQALAQQTESIIVTFRNKEGAVLEIKNLNEVGAEKLRELGFELEPLEGGN